MADFSQIEDDEERALATALFHKEQAIAALVLAAEARRRNGRETMGIVESLEFEDVTRAGYARALDNRRRELKPPLRVLTIPVGKKVRR